MYNWSTKYRGFVCKASAPEGPWSEPVRLSEKIEGDFEDPCPFWDDDGKGYLFLLGNPGALRIYRMNFKRNGFYYISVASTGKNKDKAQYIYRSKSLYGPYESRKIFHAGKAEINAAQGSLVEVSGERWAFLHHDYSLFATYGRRLYLEPAGWTADGWPWIGIDTDGDGIGEPVGLTEPYAKPALPVQPINAADPSDEFAGGTLGGQWAWNHDPDDSHWSLTAKPGHLQLTARHLNTQGGVSQFGRTKVNYRDDHLLFAYNTLVQRLYGAESDIVTKLDTARIRFAKGTATSGPGGFTDGPELKQDAIWLKLVHAHYKGTMFYSLDGEHYEPLGDRDYPYRTAWYEGTKVGLFTYNVSSAAEGGQAAFDFFHQQHDGPRIAGKSGR
ncbi:MAG: hypothetical protein EBS64_04280 [Verrucomicrobia bacterium]|nr:hypothetical protein [Verrucomicrobiota bacterium]